MGIRGNSTHLATNQIVADADLKSFAASAFFVPPTSASASSSASTLLSVAFPGHVSRALLIVPYTLHNKRVYVVFYRRI